MPIDINLLREDKGGNPELVRESQRARYADVSLVDQVLEKDNEWRTITYEIDMLRKEKNIIQKDITKIKKAKGDASELIQKKNEKDINIKEKTLKSKLLINERDNLLSQIGNIVDSTVPISDDEENNGKVSQYGELKTKEECPLHHHELLARIGGYEPVRGSRVAGHRGYFLRDAGVLLNQALINYGIAFLRSRQYDDGENYSILQPPYFMNKNVMSGVAQLEQFDEELYHVSIFKGNNNDDDNNNNEEKKEEENNNKKNKNKNNTTNNDNEDNDKYLIATSEQPICAFHKDEWLNSKELPYRYAGYSTCFRKEAGKAGKDTWGIFRVHQFEKVEQFVICRGDLEESRKMHEEMLACAEEFYQSLGLSYHVVNIVSGELNNAAAKKYDLEAWFPAMGEFKELVSASNCTDYQSRSMEVRDGVKVKNEREKKYVHMLNATLCATTRTISCILENYQTPTGVIVPDVLVPFMGGMTFIPFIYNAKGKKIKKKNKNKINNNNNNNNKNNNNDQNEKKNDNNNNNNIKKTNNTNNDINIDELNLHFRTNTYMDGYVPSKNDNDLLNKLSKLNLDFSKHSDLQRWANHISTFSESERNTWK